MRFLKKLCSPKGSTYIGTTVFIMVMMIMLVFIMQVAPVFITKMQLDTYASELCREAEIAGRIGTEVETRLERLNESTGLNPTVAWSTNGKIQMGTTFSVNVSLQTDFSFFIFAGNTITLSSTAEGMSEVYWKS